MQNTLIVNLRNFDNECESKNKLCPKRPRKSSTFFVYITNVGSR